MAVTGNPLLLPLATIAVWLLAGISLGFFSTLYGAMRVKWHLWRICSHFLDWLWFMIAAVFVLGIYLWTNWGTVHLWSLPIMGLGYGLWVWLAAPLVFRLVSQVLFVEARAVFYLTSPARWLGRRMFSSPTTLWNFFMRRLHIPKKPPPSNPPEM